MTVAEQSVRERTCSGFRKKGCIRSPITAAVPVLCREVNIIQCTNSWCLVAAKVSDLLRSRAVLAVRNIGYCARRHLFKGHCDPGCVIVFALTKVMVLFPTLVAEVDGLFAD